MSGLGKGFTPYFQIFVDSKVPYGFPYAMRHKSELLRALQTHCARLPRNPDVVIGDNAKELQHGITSSWCAEQGIALRASTPHTQAQNPCERYIHRFADVTTYLMLDAQAPPRFTIYAAETASVILSSLHIRYEDRDPTASFEIHGTAFDLRILKRWGCEVFFLLNKEQRTKFGAKGRRGVFMGYTLHTHSE
jgi:hypothetical protein